LAREKYDSKEVGFFLLSPRAAEKPTNLKHGAENFLSGYSPLRDDSNFNGKKAGSKGPT